MMVKNIQNSMETYSEYFWHIQYMAFLLKYINVDILPIICHLSIHAPYINNTTFNLIVAVIYAFSVNYQPLYAS